MQLTFPSLSRRGFVGGLAALSAGVMTGAPRPAPERRLTCNSWPFRGYFDTPAMHRYRDPRLPLLEQAEFPRFLADTFGIHAVEFLPQHFSSTSPAYVDAVRAGLAKAKSRVVNLMGAEVPGGLYNPHLNWDQVGPGVTRWLDIAVALACPSITFALGGSLPVDPAVAVRNLRPIVAAACRRRVQVLFHNDDIRRESAPQLRAIIRGLNGQAGTCLDFGNFAPRSAAYTLETVRLLAPFCHHICHAKDGIGENGHFYADDFPASMRIMEGSGFRGFYSLEYEGTGGDAVAGVRQLLEKTEAALQARRPGRT